MRKTFILIALILVCSLALGLAACNKAQETADPTPSDSSEQVDGGVVDGGVDGGSSAAPAKATLPNAKYNITFYTASDADQVDKIYGLEEGVDISAKKPADPGRPRYTFEGWFTDYDTWEKPFAFDKMPAENVVLYAKWSSSVSNAQLVAYEEEQNANSEKGHLYIHYMRFDNDPTAYDNLNLWVWPKSKTGRVFDWTRANSTVVVDDVAGAVCDVDLTKFYDKAGNAEDETLQFFTDACYSSLTVGASIKADVNVNTIANYIDPEIGFLIVYKGSKDKGTHWTSDCGNQYFRIENAIRENGSIHIYCIQDNVGDFVTDLTTEERKEVTNPYENDDGNNVSVCNVDSSADLSAMIKDTKIEDTVSGVGYQIMVASFRDSNGDGYGDIQGIIDALDEGYFTKLGVTVLWLTPIQESDSYHGYDIIDYCSVDSKFGTLEQYKTLLTKCHAKGIKVIMDLVLNHTSVNNKWFQNSAKMVVEQQEDGSVIDYRSFYHWRNWKKESLGKDWYQYSEYSYSYYGKFASSMPELNYDYQGTRDAILNVAKFWLGLLGDGTGVDGFRIDAVKHIYMADEVNPLDGDVIIKDYDDDSQTSYSSNLTKNLNFFAWLIGSVKSEYPNAYFVGENFDGHAFRVAPYYESFDGMLDFYMYYKWGEMAEWASTADNNMGGKSDALSDPIEGTNTDGLERGYWNFASMLYVYGQYGGEVIDSLFSSNHDVPRLANFVVGYQSGADIEAGTVTSANKEEAENKAKAILQLMATLPGISWIYYGDEIGLSSNYGAGEDKNSPNVDRQYRQPFKWETNANDYTTHYSISGDKTYNVEWDEHNKALAGVAEQDADPASMLNVVRKWMTLKSTDEVLRYGSYTYQEVRYGYGNGGKATELWSCLRSYNGKTYWCITNLSGNNYYNMKEVYGAKNVQGIVMASDGANMDYLPAYATIVLEIK